MKELKEKYEELKLEADKLQNEIDNLKTEIKFKDRDISQLRKDYNETFDAFKQLRNEKQILLDKLNNETKIRIEKEAELNILKEEAEELPF